MIWEGATDSRNGAQVFPLRRPPGLFSPSIKICLARKGGHPHIQLPSHTLVVRLLAQGNRCPRCLSCPIALQLPWPSLVLSYRSTANGLCSASPAHGQLQLRFLPSNCSNCRTFVLHSTEYEYAFPTRSMRFFTIKKPRSTLMRLLSLRSMYRTLADIFIG